MSAEKDKAFEEFLTEHARLLPLDYERSSIEFAFTIGWIMGKDDSFNKQYEATKERIKGLESAT